MGIATNLICLAAEECVEVALEEAQKIQSALEQISLVGSDTEIRAASFLISSVNQGVNHVMEGTLVFRAREAMRDPDARRNRGDSETIC
jgi:hypothetical protein